MRRPRNRRVDFFIFLMLALIIFFLSQYSGLTFFTSFFQTLTMPLQRASTNLFQKNDNTQLTKLKTENRDLRTQLAKLKALQKDNQALRDQFITTNPPSESLLPTYIISMPTFLPGITSVNTMNIDKGTADKVKVGNKVVFKDNLLGTVIKTSPHISVVALVNHKDFSTTAQTTKTEAVGIIKGTGDKNLLLNNVSLTDTLQGGDTVITKDPKPLVIGKIISVNKKTSSIFQSAEIQSLTDITKLKMVFIQMNQ